ncbi:MAG TPA: hypothetical protein VLM85_19330 [Polyangiaceae bacterium]|nr:hypothetical protein [Polyangiaceae bacterium]
MTRTEFEAAFRKLLTEHGKTAVNTGCIGCERCTGARDSTFCVDCKQITRCHYCRGCETCTDCSHCEACRDCLSCSHCEDSERCSGSAYLERCVGCSRCTYSLGCVGLSGKDFCILNEQYDRQTWFETVERLRRELGRAAR